jgi:hypothetical protein
MTAISIEEMLRKYPPLARFKDNPDAVRQLYAELNPKRKLSELDIGDYVNGMDVLITKVIGTSYYVGCPVCFYKKEGVEIGTSFDCTNIKCNTQRVATKLVKWTLQGGDETTKAILDFPAFAFRLDDGNKYLAKVVNISGKVQKLTDQKQDGKVVGKTPIIMVRDMKVVSDIRDPETDTLATQITKSTLAEAVEIPLGEGPKGLPTPPVSPVTPPISTIPETKLKAFNTWMTIMKTVTEAQLKNHVESNLKLKLDDVLPLVDKHFQDSTQTTVYTLRPEPTH